MTSTFDPNNQRVDALTLSTRTPLKAISNDHAGLVELRLRWALVEAKPVFAAGRSAGTDASWGTLDIRTLLRGEESAGRFSVHDLVVAPGAGLPPHYHVDAYTYVLICDGELKLRVGDLEEQVTENDFALVPPRTRFGFRNLSSTSVSLILIHTPAGVERAFEEAHAQWEATGDEQESSYLPILERYGFRFDEQLLENDSKTNASVSSVDFEFTKLGDMELLREAFANLTAVPRLIKTTPTEIEAVTSTGKVFRKAVVTGDDSGGQAMVHLLASGEGLSAPPHHQPGEVEFFFIRGGEVDVVCGSESGLVGRGAFAFAPHNGTHAFRVTEASGCARFFTLNSPAGHERALAELRVLNEAGAPREQKEAMMLAGGWIMH